MDDEIKIKAIIKLFDDILENDTLSAIKLLKFFINRIRKKNFLLRSIPKYESITTTVFNRKAKNNYVVKKIESRVKDILTNLKIKIDNNNYLHLIDEVVVFEITAIGELNPICFFTMVENRKCKSETEKFCLINRLKDNFKNLENNWRKFPQTDGRIIIQNNNKKEDFDIMIKKGIFIFGFNNYKYSLDEIKTNFKVKTDCIESEVRSINNVYID